MSPRPYQLGKRQALINESRRRVIGAARALLAEAVSYPAFTVDAVAKRADVARATVYYQFRSKTGLLEAVCDDLAETGGMGDLAHAFGRPDPRDALRDLIMAFGRFWAADRLVMRRLRALAVLDADVQAVVAARDERRRHGLGVIAGRLLGAADVTPPAGAERAIGVLQALTSFEFFDSLAGLDGDPDGDPAGAATLVCSLAEAALGIDGAGTPIPSGRGEATAGGDSP
jgi:AcrR family transcriptional regulator